MTPCGGPICPLGGARQRLLLTPQGHRHRPGYGRSFPTYSLTIWMPRDRAEPMMHLTTVSREEFLILKLSSWALTWAISYTALTDTIPAVSWPSEEIAEVGQRQSKQRSKEKRKDQSRNRRGGGGGEARLRYNCTILFLPSVLT